MLSSPEEAKRQNDHKFKDSSIKSPSRANVCLFSVVEAILKLLSATWIPFVLSIRHCLLQAARWKCQVSLFLFKGTVPFRFIHLEGDIEGNF